MTTDEEVAAVKLELEEFLGALRAALDEAESKAWDSLSRYKFQMFGYWSAWWVKLNRLGKFNRANPFRDLVVHGRAVCSGHEIESPIPACECGMDDVTSKTCPQHKGLVDA